MRGYNSLLKKDYEIVIMKRKTLREKIMKDNNISENDIFKFFSLLNVKTFVDCKQSKTTNLFKIYQENYLIDKGFLNNEIKNIYEREKTSEEIEATIKKENIKKEDEQFYRECLLETSVYKSVSKKEWNDILLKNIISETEKTKDDYTPYILSGIEVNPIIINELPCGKYQLIDGFLRLLFGKIDDNIDILVKIYKNLSDIEFLSELSISNLWKKESEKFFDRGFLFALEKRFNIKIDEYIGFNLLKEPLNIISVLKYYSSIISNPKIDKSEFYFNCKEFKPYEVLFNNKYVINDLKELKLIIDKIPIIGDDFLKTNQKKLPYYYEKLLITFISTIGEIRYQYRDVLQNDLNSEVFFDLFNNKTWKNECKKMNNMSVSGHIDNRLTSLYQEMYTIVYNHLIK